MTILWATALIILLVGAVAFFARRNGQVSERNKINNITVERAKRNAEILSRPAGSHADIVARMRKTNKRMPRAAGASRTHYS